MAWLRVDDGLAEHRKLLQLRRSDRWTWMELLCYVARQNNGGHVPANVGDVLRHAKPPLLQRFHEIGLLDIDPERSEYVVHDWVIYNGGNLEHRVAAYLEANPDATANEVVKAVSGNRKLVLALVSQNRGSGS